LGRSSVLPLIVVLATACAASPTGPARPRPSEPSRSTKTRVEQTLFSFELGAIRALAPVDDGVLVLGTLPRTGSESGVAGYEAIYRLRGNDVVLVDSGFCPRATRPWTDVPDPPMYRFVDLAPSPLGLELFGWTLGDIPRLVHARRAHDGTWLCDLGTWLEPSTRDETRVSWFHDQNGIWLGLSGEGLVRLTSTRRDLPALPDDVESFAIGDREGRRAWAISDDRLFEMAGLRWVDRTSTLPQDTKREFVSVAVLPDGRASLVTKTGSSLLFHEGAWTAPATSPAMTPARVVAGGEGDFWFYAKRRLSRYRNGEWSTIELEAEPGYLPMVVGHHELYFVVGSSGLLRVVWEDAP
jgi:hypothetical protein